MRPGLESTSTSGMTAKAFAAKDNIVTASRDGARMNFFKIRTPLDRRKRLLTSCHDAKNDVGNEQGIVDMCK